MKIQNDINVVGIFNGGQKFFFYFANDKYAQVVNVAGRYASDPELNFSWRDAATLIQRAQKLTGQGKADRF